MGILNGERITYVLTGCNHGYMYVKTGSLEMGILNGEKRREDKGFLFEGIGLG